MLMYALKPMTTCQYRRVEIGDFTMATACRWFVASKAIFIMHFVVALLCSIGLWAMLIIFSMRLRQAITSGKAWSRRRRSGCFYAYTLSVIQVSGPIAYCAFVTDTVECYRGASRPDNDLTNAQTINASCYLASNSIILYGRCQWFSPAVFWLAFVRWEVRKWC